MISKFRWLLPFAVLPLLGLPLVAQENEPATAESAAEAQVSDDAELDDPLEEEAQTLAPLPAGPEERVSADNNLSFPVDI